jgi:hypothetical protein
LKNIRKIEIKDKSIMCPKNTILHFSYIYMKINI